MLSYKKGFNREVHCGKFNAEAYEKGTKKTFFIKSDFGYILSCELLNPQVESSMVTEGGFSQKVHKIAILCHGLGYAKYGSLKYAEIFIKLGFTVLIYDHRNHGLSGKAHTSMGFYEKYDLKKVIDWCVEQYGPDCKIVTHGESMGAATVLLHLGIDDRVDCAIADCAYSDLKQLLHHQLKTFYHLPCFLIPIESCITYLRAGFWYKAVSPIKIISQTDTPIMLIHGKIDNLVPAKMSKQMYESIKKNKAIYLVAGAKHAESYCVNKVGYEKRVEAFLNTFLH
jgi:fermentation-respiration switch protein FrsA (DUF1100 family)